MSIELSILISVISVSAALVFGFSNFKKTQEKEITERARTDQKVQDALDKIGETVKQILAELTDYKKTLDDHKDRIMILENGQKHIAEDVVSLEERVEKLEDK